MGLYIIDAKTNMHVGSGDITYDIVDKKVQRDVVTSYPVIYSSSLKGALREYFNYSGESDEIVKYIFGSESDSSNESFSEGQYKFFNANLLSIPVRSNKKPFYRATCGYIIREFLDTINNFNISFSDKELFEGFIEKANEVEDNSPVVLDTQEGVILEDYIAAKGFDFSKIKEIERYLGENIAVFSDNDFKEFVKYLPIIARNKLTNGESKNLWYEEVVPRESRFYYVVLAGEKYQTQFKNVIEKTKEKPIQIGANASIGFGYAFITKVGDIDESKKS
ncbi:type III-B CRISPR module RAMP protein Cmr4 [Acetivibrio mesophilus]|uniref:Type III-B CRISPR module RAMP protein Cmr4 n=1 Tax=Acetivibrio mesophilus TaxID=2487273 RepID=A0A4Q0I0Q2_9FIRM|nr:type III-B CRISPR module RAMP protein Cmr4 [Acetivibrio mesophilus]RXE57796.1 type III-B CRISPR module RAMP protein Cmr4 [Acetivibrio mesophilus]